MYSIHVRINPKRGIAVMISEFKQDSITLPTPV